MNVLDLFFFLMIGVCVFFQTWGYSFGDRGYVGAVALVGILVAAKMLSTHYGGRDLVVCIILLGLGFFYALYAHRYTVLLSALLLIAARGIDVRKVLSGYCKIKIVALLSLLFFAAIGVFGVETVSHYRMASKTFDARVVINGASTNIVHLGYFTVTVLWLCLRYKRIEWWAVASFIAGDIALFLFFTRSLTGLVMTIVAVALIYLCSRLKWAEGALLWVAPFLPVAMMAFMVGLGYSYGSGGVVDYLNRVSSGRISFDHYWLTNYGPTLLGSNFSELNAEGNFDDSFVFVLVVYGVPFAILLYGAVTALLVKMRRGGRSWSLARCPLPRLQRCGEHVPQRGRQSFAVPARQHAFQWACQGGWHR